MHIKENILETGWMHLNIDLSKSMISLHTYVPDPYLDIIYMNQ